MTIPFDGTNSSYGEDEQKYVSDGEAQERNVLRPVTDIVGGEETRIEAHEGTKERGAGGSEITHYPLFYPVNHCCR